MIMTLKTDLAWLAGFMDGEGAIGVTRMRDRKYHNDRYLRPHFQACNTDLRLVEEASRIVFSVTKKKPWVGLTHQQTETRKPAWTIAIHTKTVLSILLPAVIPYLVGKRRQAEIVLQVCKRRYKRSYELDQIAFEECRRLNQRGVIDAPRPTLRLVKEG